jgi:hypothetical protein
MQRTTTQPDSASTTPRSGAINSMSTSTLTSERRDEFADHGRPYSGRQGGELSVQREQDEPRARGTSAAGGSDREGTDPGEYF